MQWMWIVLAFNLVTICLSGHELINLKHYDPHLRIAGNRDVFLVCEAAMQLSRVQRDLAKEGIVLVVLRGYLPQSQSPSCLADSTRDFISRTYSRGTAVDVTMEYDSGNPLQLPCPPYSPLPDACSERNGDYIHSQCCCTLQILERIMSRHGFIRAEKAWWYFEHRNWRLYPPLNLSVRELILQETTCL